MHFAQVGPLPMYSIAVAYLGSNAQCHFTP